MSDLPPRRSRPPSNDAEQSLPLIPILIGVIVLGFIIGAGLSIARRHAAPPAVAVDTATRPPATEPPVTPAPTEKPTVTPTVAPAAAPSETDAATDAATDSPTGEAASSPTPSAAATASAKATRTPQRATPSPSASAAPSVTVAHAAPASNAVVPPSPRPAATRQVATAAPMASAPAATDAPASSDDVDSDFGHLASAVVRQYLGAIARGDTASAYAAFGAAPGDANVKLTESGIVGPSAHIAHVEVRGAGDNATVNVDLKTAAGIYSAQYTVHRTPSGAALIVDHSIVKP